MPKTPEKETPQKLPQSGILIAMKKTRERKVRLVEGKGLFKGQTFLEHLTYDDSIRKWRIVSRELRNDLKKVKPFMLELIGDEGNSEVEEYVGVGCDPDTDRWRSTRCTTSSGFRPGSTVSASR
jgi:hypothetical protein